MESIYQRYVNVPRAILSGVTSGVDEEKRKIIDFKISNIYCEGFNPGLIDVLPQLCEVIGRYDNISMSCLKRDLGITKSDIMIYFACFANDHHLKEVDKFITFVPDSLQFIDEVFKHHDTFKTTVGIRKQLDISLNISKGDLTKAIILLALGTREMARVSDGRMFGKSIDMETVFKWKTTIKAFGYDDNDQDATGDTYHFWHAVLAGISREEDVDYFITKKIKQVVCDFVYPNTAIATDLLRNKLYLGIKEWNTHEVLDKLGYSVGRTFVSFYSVAQCY